MFSVQYIHLQNRPVLCTTYKLHDKTLEVHRAYLQKPKNSLYTSKVKNIKIRNTHCFEM